jgi:uncharacterized protein YndB with AHSA1/START domain/DNA-binding transcriptional ArsR family regulator
MDDVFRALADPHRRELLDRLNARNGQTLRELCADLDMSRQAVSKHLAVLEAASLVTTLRRGREKLHHLNPAPIREIADRWIHRYDRARVDALADLKRALEDTMPAATDRPEFVYTTYIRTTPERLFAALTEPAFTRRYWALELDTDWRLGSTITWVQRGVPISHPEQLVLECDPPRRLSYMWHTFTPEWAEAVGLDDAVRARIAREPRSRATFELEPEGELVKLTVVHDGFAPDSEVLQMVSGGWPRVVGALKTLLETGVGSEDEGFTREVVVDAPVSAVHQLLTSLDGLARWWANEVDGEPGTLGGEFTLAFETEAFRLQVEHLEPTLVVWRCIDVPRHQEWRDTTMWFELRPQGSSTVVSFRHVGLLPSYDCYDESSTAWIHSLHSLERVAEASEGEHHGSAGRQAARAAAP